MTGTQANCNCRRQGGHGGLYQWSAVLTRLRTVDKTILATQVSNLSYTSLLVVVALLSFLVNVKKIKAKKVVCQLKSIVT